ncbi:hypothetical protein [Thiosulfatihalobacter marinus]|uniref:hypothetical protein n=1 Tax=Thiosulfatihalobacter marinus TaxID=2792481 RepID=UPI0018D9A123|nr:hypothetical protein [Thiosulfatihalobacter marinus]
MADGDNVLIFFAAVLAALAAAYWLHHLFEGERFLPDLIREWRLSRVDLATLESFWASADKADIVVSLTTIPSRIAHIDTVLKGLLAQTRPPARIVLNVPDHSLREETGYDIPAHLAGLASVEIRRGRDWGPATKLIPTVLTADPDQLIVVVDDDRIYPADFLETFERAAAETPDRALTMAGWIVPADLTDRPTTVLSNLLQRPPAPLRGHRLRRARTVDVFLGVFGYAVRPRFFDQTDLADFSDTPRAAFLVDDVRSSALCLAPIDVIPNRGLSCLPKARAAHYRLTALSRINNGGGDPEDRNNTRAIRHYGDRWQVGGPTMKAGGT